MRRIGPTILSVLMVLPAILPPTVCAAEAKQVLIAAQASTVKDAVVARVAEALGRDGHQVRVIALEEVADEPLGRYQAILLVNSCYAWRPNQDVRDLLGRAGADDRRKFVVVTTAGSGKCDFDAPGVDLVSSASKRTRIEDLSRVILDKIRSRLTSR
jgi:hypothetical protein